MPGLELGKLSTGSKGRDAEIKEDFAELKKRAQDMVRWKLCFSCLLGKCQITGLYVNCCYKKTIVSSRGS